GYAGGLACLVVALFGLIQTDTPPFGLDPEAQEPVRAAVLLVALWYGLFSLPLFLFVPDRQSKGDGPKTPALQAMAQSGKRLWATLKMLKEERTIAWFLFARMLYTDGLNTMFAFGGIYAAGTFGMSFADIILFGILMNVAAGSGAALFGSLDDRLGSKPTILIGLVGLIGFGCVVLLAPDVTWFWIGALCMGAFFGPVQASSRTLMARLAPEDMRGELFGLFALSGRITAFLGPIVLALVTDITNSQRLGMASVLLFLIPGCLLLWWKVRAVQ
ncbi:MAG: MFS transporter, partial [Rhodospirillaceae bacterium]